MATAELASCEPHASSLFVALEIYPQMAMIMINDFPPKTVLRMIENDPNNKFMKSLNNSEKKLIPTLYTYGYNMLDIPLLYKLMCRFNVIPAPSENWGKRPSLDTYFNQGDDMERMRINHNDLVHRSQDSLSKEEGDAFFKESIEIACSVDNMLGDSISRFVEQIESVRKYHITEEQSNQALEKCPVQQQQLKDISGIKPVDFYYGHDIEIKLGHQESPATDSTRYTIYIRGSNINDPAIREKLEQAKKSFNEESCHIKLLKAESGSLVLHVEINNLCFTTKDSLHKAIAEFLRIVFTSIIGSLEQHIKEVVLTECDGYIISDNEEENDDYLNDQESLELQLGAMAMTRPQVDEGAAGSALLDDKEATATQEDKTKEDPIILYRLLRPSEFCRGGLHAKNPYSTASIFDHVVKGSYGPPSKYISTCGSWEAMSSFRGNSTGKIVEIQIYESQSNVEIIDLRSNENRYQYIDNFRDESSIRKFHNFANKFKVVLLVGHVPETSLKLCDN